MARKPVVQLVNDIKKYGSEKKVLISSFNPLVLFWLKQLKPDLPRALIVGDEKVLTGWLFEYYIKFQKSKLKAKFTRKCLQRPYNSVNAWGSTYGEHKEYLEFDLDELRQLRSYAEVRKSIHF